MNDFSKSDDSLDGLDCGILNESPIVLYWRPEIWLKHLNWFDENKYKTFTFDAMVWKTELDFHKCIKDVLNFPDYYGENLDALNDCLGDLDFNDCVGIVIAIKNYHFFTKFHHQTAQRILDIIAYNSWKHIISNKRFLALIQTDVADASYEPVGARPVIWNREEWLNSKRGL